MSELASGSTPHPRTTSIPAGPRLRVEDMP
jgi:hypothetical protein